MHFDDEAELFEQPLRAARCGCTVARWVIGGRAHELRQELRFARELARDELRDPGGVAPLFRIIDGIHWITRTRLTI